MALIKVVKQRFEEYVTHCANAEIWARVVDTAKLGCSEESIQLLGNILPAKQRRDIKRGTRFDIEIGYHYGPKHVKREFVKINLHKPSLWTQAEIDECKRNAEELCELLGD